MRREEGLLRGRGGLEKSTLADLGLTRARHESDCSQDAALHRWRQRVKGRKDKRYLSQWGELWPGNSV